MKLSLGFTRPPFSVLLFVFYLGSILLLTLALKRIEVVVAYAVWSASTCLVSSMGERPSRALCAGSASR